MSSTATNEESKKLAVVFFDNSPDCGPDCICSVCTKPIYEEQGPALRFYNSATQREARFHLECAGKLRLINSL